MSHCGDFEHHLQVSVGNYVPNIWVMFNWDIYQPMFVLMFDRFASALKCSRYHWRRCSHVSTSKLFQQLPRFIWSTLGILYNPKNTSRCDGWFAVILSNYAVSDLTENGQVEGVDLTS